MNIRATGQQGRRRRAARAIAMLTGGVTGGLTALLAGPVTALVLAMPAAAQDITLRMTNLTLPSGRTEVTIEEEELMALPQHVVRTSNEFVDGETEFEGPLARDVVAVIGRGSARIARMIASNDYAAEVDLQEFEQYEVIFAHSMNGDRLSRRERGPLWVIYPMDDHSELQDPSYNNRLVWQLVRVELR